jgi:hypothetical protein
MEPITLILGALLAGAVKGVGESATAAVKDAYTRFRDVLGQRLTTPAAQEVIKEFTADPGSNELVMRAYLQKVDAALDQRIVDAAEAVMAATDPRGAADGKYTVDARGARGVQIGNYNRQRNDFRTES